jgi:hypothetical protein
MLASGDTPSTPIATALKRLYETKGAKFSFLMQTGLVSMGKTSLTENYGLKSQLQ